jgi:hypothetical protein
MPAAAATGVADCEDRAQLCHSLLAVWQQLLLVHSQLMWKHEIEYDINQVSWTSSLPVCCKITKHGSAHINGFDIPWRAYLILSQC